jgi:hypothetical protein
MPACSSVAEVAAKGASAASSRSFEQSLFFSHFCSKLASASDQLPEHSFERALEKMRTEWCDVAFDLLP